MAQTSKDLFQVDLARTAELAKALSHPARIAILQLIAQRTTCVCGEIVSELPLAQSTVSQHLKELQRVGLIKGEIDGPRTCYCLDLDALEAFRGAMEQLFDDFAAQPRQECC